MNYQKKYELLNKYEPIKRYEVSNLFQSNSSAIQSKPQQIKNNWLNNNPTNKNLYQQRKIDYSKSINENINIKNNTSDNNIDVRDFNPQIYKNEFDYHRKMTKLKYYDKCPNCGFQLNDETTINNYNRTLVYSNISKNSVFGSF